MKHDRPIPAQLARPAASVAVLRCRETFAMDPAPLYSLFGELGDVEAEAMICRALEDIAARLDQLQAYRRAGTLAEVDRPARRVSSIARQIGLTDLAQAAEHVGCAARMSNSVAIGATLARLERSFDAAVSLIWNFREYRES